MLHSEFKVKGQELVYGFADLALVFECQVSEIVWQVKILCVSSWKKTVIIQKTEMSPLAFKFCGHKMAVNTSLNIINMSPELHSRFLTSSGLYILCPLEGSCKHIINVLFSSAWAIFRHVCDLLPASALDHSPELWYCLSVPAEVFCSFCHLH